MRIKRWLVPIIGVGLLLGGGETKLGNAQLLGWPLPNEPGFSALGASAVSEGKGHPKIASRLSQAAGMVSAFAQANRLSELPRITSGFARIDQQGRIEVYVTLEKVTEESLAALRNAGLEIEIYDAQQRLVQGWISPAQIQVIADLPVVKFVDLPNYGMTNAGSVTTQGDAVIRGDQFRTLLGVTGSGVKVGVISDGINGLTSSIASGDLPTAGITMPAAPLTGGGISLDSPLPGATVFTSTPVGRSDLTSGLAEGRAMLEIIHDIAPDAQFFFAPVGTPLADQRAIRWLVSQGVKVIADDHIFFNLSPYDGTSEISKEASNAVTSGTNYFVSVGNSAQRHYRGLFTDTDGDGFHEFDVSLGFPRVDNAGETLNVTVQPGEVIGALLQWNDPFGASANDYDLCLVFPADNPSSTVGCSMNLQTGTQNPVEPIGAQINPSLSSPVTLGIRINRVSMAAPRIFDLFIVGGVLQEFMVPAGSVPNKADASGGVISVGAVNWLTPSAIEPFSSRGPTSDGRMKPELVSPDGVATSVPGFSSFLGTSASAPHAAGLAALLLSKVPNLTPGQVGRALQDATLDLGAPGLDNTFGHGLLDASVFTRMLHLRVQ